MAQPFSRMIAIALLSAMVGVGAGVVCLLPASAAPTHTAGCHPVRVPSDPQPADYRCCVGRHASALTTAVFSPRPAVESVETDATDPSLPIAATQCISNLCCAFRRPARHSDSQNLISDSLDLFLTHAFVGPLS